MFVNVYLINVWNTSITWWIPCERVSSLIAPFDRLDTPYSTSLCIIVAYFTSLIWTLIVELDIDFGTKSYSERVWLLLQFSIFVNKSHRKHKASLTALIQQYPFIKAILRAICYINAFSSILHYRLTAISDSLIFLCPTIGLHKSR